MKEYLPCSLILQMCKTCYVFPLQHSSSPRAFSKLSNKLFCTLLEKQGMWHTGSLHGCIHQVLRGHWKERGGSPAILTYISSLLHSIRAVGTVCHSDCCFPRARRAHFPPEVLDKMIIPSIPQNNRNIGLWRYLKDSWDRSIRKIKPFLSCRYKWAFSYKKRLATQRLCINQTGREQGELGEKKDMWCQIALPLWSSFCFPTFLSIFKYIFLLASKVMVQLT